MIGIWARRLRPASFRGVPFFIDSHEFGTGRNTADHETPGQDRTFSEDLGLKTRTYNIDGHILGDDYFRLRDNLVKACEENGPGQLVHPYLGTKTVQCKNFSFTEKTREGRIAQFSIEFVEAGEQSFPVGLFDKISEFFDAANNAVDAVKASFDAVWAITNVPGFVIDEATVLFDNALNSVADAVTKVRALPDKKSAIEQKIVNLGNRKSALIIDTNLLSVEFGNLIKDLKDSVDDPESVDSIDVSSGRDDKLTVFDDLVVFGDDAGDLIITPTPSRQKQNSNQTAFNNMIKQNAIVALAEASVIKDFKTIQEATAQREALIDLIEGVTDITENDAVFQTFSDLKAKVIVTVPNDAVVLSSEVSLDFQRVETTLTVIYDLTGNISGESDFISRNNKTIRNPAFLSPGKYVAVNG